MTSPEAGICNSKSRNSFSRKTGVSNVRSGNHPLPDPSRSLNSCQILIGIILQHTLCIPGPSGAGGGERHRSRPLHREQITSPLVLIAARWIRSYCLSRFLFSISVLRFWAICSSCFRHGSFLYLTDKGRVLLASTTCALTASNR